ncbi:DUF6343 family protein [Streptomyces sp. NPDC012623]|uniref:DUF6343 family protein n=1 Tax=unclassified Streptomyces TaxID=2593676 RepID=UPI003683918F
MPTRTGSEPVTARSALRMRFWLSVWGLICTGVGTVAFALAGRPWWALACAVLLLIVVTDLFVILRRMRQGPRFQPDRGIGPRPPGHGPAVPLEEDRERERDLVRQRRNRTGVGVGRRRHT